MSAPPLRSYRVSLVHGEYAVLVTAESGQVACELAERLWREKRCVLVLPVGTIEWTEILDNYDDSDAC